MKTKHLLETASLLSESASEGTWKVRVINEGQGSSGFYSRELLEKYHSAFDGVLSYNNHPVGEVGLQGRNFMDIVGSVDGETWTEEDEEGNLGVYANWKPDDDFKRKLEQYKDKLGLSIFISGDGREDDNGDFIVESFDGSDPFRSLDVVIAAGRGGRFEESLRPIYQQRINEADAAAKPGAPSAQDPHTKEAQTMNEEDLKKIIESLKAAIVESIKPLAEANAEKDKDQLSLEEALAAYAETVKVIDAAELFDTQAESLKARAAKGEDITDALEEAKKIRDEARASVQAESAHQPGGRTLGEGAGYKGATAWGAR